MTNVPTNSLLRATNGPSKVHTEVTDEMLSYVDVLVDGEFVEAEKDLTLQFRGSRNQRILELKRIGRK